jgi:hypothetical protein
VVLELFKERISIKKADINAACMKTFKENIPQNAYSKIMKELAYQKQSLWIFKTGNGTE